MSELGDKEIPAGWASAQLGELGEYINGRGFKKSEWSDAGRPIIRIQNLTGSGTSFNHYAGALEDRHTVRPGDLLFSWAATLGVYIWQGPEAALNQHIFKVVPFIDRSFLRHLIDRKIHELTAASHGSGMVHITRSKFDELPVAIPPLSEQQRISETLEGYFARIDSACESLRRSLVRVIHLRQSTIRRALRGDGIPASASTDAVSDFHVSSQISKEDQPWSIPDGWVWASVGSLFRVYVGTTPSRKMPELWSGPIPWVSSGEVNFSRISDTREHISEEAVGNRKTRLHPPGTVMIAMIGEGKTRGQVAILDVEAAHNQNCASIRVSETRILPEYVYLVLEQRYQQSRQASSGGNQQALNKAKVEEIPVPLPPLETQQYIVAMADEFSATSDRLRLELERTLKIASRLRQALLARAFTGRLLPQDPADEPASVLLDRIRAEREEKGGKRRRSTRRPRKAAAEGEAPPPPAVSPIPITAAVQQELPL
ncbi:hypothetical protein GTY54_00035 [Streptomyces sp. SID625]|nr:hypothetical protein [Streptomyces sp. SID625]